MVKSGRNNWEGLTVLFGYPKDIKKAIYIVNAIESLNSMIRIAMSKGKGKVFPSSIQGSLSSNTTSIQEVVDAHQQLKGCF